MQFNPPLEISTFEKGFTDNYIDGPVNGGQIFDNVYILKNRRIKSRPGRAIYNSTYPQIPAGNQRVGALLAHPQSELFVQSARALYYLSSGWQTLVGPVSSNPAFSSNAVTNYISWDRWRNHIFAVSDSYADPIKIYKDSSNAWQVRTAGMPSLDLEGAIDVANDIKSKYNSHRTEGSRHGTADDTVNVVSSSDAYDFDSLVTLVTELLTDFSAHDTDALLAGSWAYHSAQESPSNALSSTTAPTSISECVTRLTDLKAKYDLHDANATTHTGAGSLSTTAQLSPTVTGAGTATYLYRFLYFYQYTVGDVIFQDVGATLEVTGSSLTTGTKSIANIPAIANGTTRCYDTANIKVYVYRTIDAGSTFYYVGNVTNGTTTFSDTVTDADLVLNDPLYTNGGDLDNDPPPRAKFLKITNDFALFGNVKEGTIARPSRYRVSKPSDIDSSPEDFYGDVEEPITGVSNISIYPIIFCRNRVYRIEGLLDAAGRGSLVQREVSRVKGSINNRGIVQIPQGLVFPGEDGFYFTDGYAVQPISIHLVESYKDIVTNATMEGQIEGLYDSVENRVIWTLQRDSSNSDNDAHFVLDLNFGLTPESVFVTQSGGDSWRNTALAVYDGDILMGDKRGYIFKFASTSLTDPKVDTAVAAADWNTKTIIWDYTTCALSFGSTHVFKWVPLMTLEAKNETNVTISVQSNNNDSNSFSELKEIRFREDITWGDPTVTYGSTAYNYFWNLYPVVDAKRRFPAGGIRCNLKQLKITNAYTIIYRSDDLVAATVDSALKTATISGFTWATEIVDYYISFEDDDYTNDYLITTINSTTKITFSDPSNTAPSGSQKWVIRGKIKGEVLHLISLGIRNAYLGPLQKAYDGVTGENA